LRGLSFRLMPARSNKGSVLKTILLLIFIIAIVFAVTTAFSYLWTKEPYYDSGFTNYRLGWPYTFYDHHYEGNGFTGYIKYEAFLRINFIHDLLISSAAGSLILFLLTYRKKGH
jgi:hypothetical protein